MGRGRGSLAAGHLEWPRSFGLVFKQRLAFVPMGEARVLRAEQR